MADVILFDLDGTLTDSGPGITRCVQYALKAFDIEEPDPGKLECYVGPPLLESFEKFAGLEREKAKQAVLKYRERYSTVGIFENKVYEGIPELLAFLKSSGKLLGVASSKPEKFVRQILEHFELLDYFQVVTGSKMDGGRSLKSEVIEETLARIGYRNQRSRVVMVGDRYHDVEGANRCGIPCVGAAFGYGGREELQKAGAVLVCDTVAELRILAREETSWEKSE